jgi:hypothetical protein
MEVQSDSGAPMLEPYSKNQAYSIHLRPVIQSHGDPNRTVMANDIRAFVRDPTRRPAPQREALPQCYQVWWGHMTAMYLCGQYIDIKGTGTRRKFSEILFSGTLHALHDRQLGQTGIDKAFAAAASHTAAAARTAETNAKRFAKWFFAERGASSYPCFGASSSSRAREVAPSSAAVATSAVTATATAPSKKSDHQTRSQRRNQRPQEQGHQVTTAGMMTQLKELAAETRSAIAEARAAGQPAQHAGDRRQREDQDDYPHRGHGFGGSRGYGGGRGGENNNESENRKRNPILRDTVTPSFPSCLGQDRVR